jgi:hypothetical protein
LMGDLEKMRASGKSMGSRFSAVAASSKRRTRTRCVSVTLGQMML